MCCLIKTSFLKLFFMLILASGLKLINANNMKPKNEENNFSASKAVQKIRSIMDNITNTNTNDLEKNQITTIQDPTVETQIENSGNTELATTDKNMKRERKAVKLTMKQGLTMNQILGIYALTEAEDGLCKNHSLEFSTGMRAFKPWALKMFDSSSKLQAGVLLGNLVEYGSFQQCIHIYQNSEFGPIRGKHCTLRVSPDIYLLKKILTFRNVSEMRWDKVKVFVENATLNWSICVPDSCSADDVLSHMKKIVLSLTEGLNISISLSENNCYTVFDDKRYSKTEISIIVAFGLYVMVIIVFTIVDFYSTPEKVAENKLISIFSARQNTRQIFAKSKESDLDCVHGIRFISTCYVIIGHRYLMMMFFPVINSLEIMDWILYYRSTLITGGTLCVDTFFMISGMLVSFGYFEQLSKGQMNWFMFYFYRYARITPPLAIVVLWMSTLMQHFGSGPLWRDMLEIIQKPCQEYWWATILHIQNYVHPFPLCMTQTWYLTCDMQYYFLSPIILLPLAKNTTLGYINYSLVYGISVVVSFYFAWINKYNGGVPVTNQLFSTKYFQHHYIAPHTRAATYIIGLGFGYVAFKSKGKHMKISYGTAIVGWMVCLVIMLASLVGCHVFFLEEHDYNRIESSVFIAISRTAWTLGIVWMVWACINGYGGPINFVLSLQVFKVLGRISYGMFLLHMGIQYMMSGAMKMPVYFADFYSLFAAFGDLFIMVIIGFLFTVLFESPIVKSLSILIKGGSKRDVSKIHPVMSQKQEQNVTNK